MSRTEADDDLETPQEVIEGIRRGIESAKAGRTLPHSNVREWLKTWGTGDDPPPPKSGR